ncbi:MAG: hypothetical protein IT270_20790 [Saprospiraceae bacterium]|nr:hypothetical protein [Saprospiraceae bacterium]
MESNPENTPEGRELLQQLKQSVQVLEQKLEEANTSQQKYTQEMETLLRERSVFQSVLQKLTDDHLQLEKDYETLRIQKGGFGFKILWLSGFLGFLSGLVLCYLFFRPSSKHELVFSNFQHATQFHVEYAIGQGDFVQAEELLKKSSESRDYKIIEPEIDMMRKIVSAAKRRCE